MCPISKERKFHVYIRFIFFHPIFFYSLHRILTAEKSLGAHPAKHITQWSPIHLVTMFTMFYTND